MSRSRTGLRRTSTPPTGRSRTVDNPPRVPSPDTTIDGAQRLVETELEDLVSLAARGRTDNGNRTSLDDVLARCGDSREDLEAIPDEEPSRR